MVNQPGPLQRLLEQRGLRVLSVQTEPDPDDLHDYLAIRFEAPETKKLGILKVAGGDPNFIADCVARAVASGQFETLLDPW